MRWKYQKIFPPAERSDDLDFDPGAKYHIPSNTPYLRYFCRLYINFNFMKLYVKPLIFMDHSINVVIISPLQQGKSLKKC
eukprot:UN16839